MKDYLENTRRVSSEVAGNLADLPELHPTLEAIFKNASPGLFGKESPRFYIGRTYIEYLRIIKDLTSLSDEDLEMIRKADDTCEQLKISSNSAAHGGARHFLEVLGPEKTKHLFNLVQASSNIKSPIFKEAVIDLNERMTMGHDLAQRGAPIGDGASADADYAIWGHTKGLQPKAMIHFVMLHFLQRTFTAQFAQDPDERIRNMVKDKDALVTAMTDVILLRTAQGKMKPEITEMWAKARDKGGLGWNESTKQGVYDLVVGKSAIRNLRPKTLR